MSDSKTCLACGTPIPDGKMLCEPCAEMMDNAPDDCEECKLHLEEAD